MMIVEMAGGPVGEHVIRTIAMPADTNPAGDIFGGWLMSQMDLAAGSVATRRAKRRCVTFAGEGMYFLSPGIVGDEVSLYAGLMKTGRTSMRIEVQAWRRQREGSQMTIVTHATFSFVAVVEDRKPRPLPEEASAI